MKDAKIKRENIIREAKINIILDAAQRVFALHGFHEARLEDIAAEAGFSKASLYNYYEDKESIFLSLAIRDYNRLIHTLKEIIEANIPFKEKMSGILEMIFKMFGEHFAIFLEISNFLTHSFSHIEKIQKQRQELAQNFRQSHREIFVMITSLVKLSKEKGEISSTLKDEVIAKYFSSLIRGVIFDWRVAGAVGDWQQETKDFIEFISRGIAGC